MAHEPKDSFSLEIDNSYFPSKVGSEWLLDGDDVHYARSGFFEHSSVGIFVHPLAVRDLSDYSE